MALGLPDDPAQQRKLLIGMVPLLALFGYWYFLHDAEYVPELEAMEARIERLEGANALARVRAPQSLELEERLVQFERHIERLEELVPRGEEVSRLLNTISQRADQIGVTVARFTPGQTAAGEHYNRRVFDMTVQGGYHQLGRFLSEIGSLPRIITPTDLHILTASDDSEDPRLEASFRIETYVLPDTRRPEGATSE